MIRTNQLVADYEYISQHDEAVDSDAEEFTAKWQRYLDGLEPPPLKKGHKPTVFTLRQLRAPQKAKLSRLFGDDDRRLELCYVAGAMAVVKADEIRDISNNLIELKHVTEDGVQMLDSDSLEAIGFEVAVELGSVALTRSSPRPNS